MAHTSMNKIGNGEPVFGTYEGSRGAQYFITTDGAGCITCTCMDFMSGKTAKGTPIGERVCKHLRDVLSGRGLEKFTPRPKAGSALSVADEIKKDLTDIEKELAQAKTARQIEHALGRFPKIRERATAFQELLDLQMSEITDRLVSAKRAAQEKI